MIAITHSTAISLLNGLNGFLIYAFQENLSREAILETVLHDLNGTFTPTFLPRTDSYMHHVPDDHLFIYKED